MTVSMPARPTPRLAAPSAPVLMPHQQLIHDFLATHPYAGAWLGVGAGKTLTTLRALQTTRPIGHILVVAPVAIARSTWIDEIEKWRFPIRTRSLIVNDNDRKLSRKKRLERFRQVFTDPPTMYFINQELLTQPSQGTRLLTPATAAGASPVSPEAVEVLDLLRANSPMTEDELISEYRSQLAAPVIGDPSVPSPAKSTIRAWIQELVKASAVRRGIHSCRTCSGTGCAECRFGLVDQMPIQDINGQKTIIWPFQTVIIDESQGFRSHASERFKALQVVRPAISRVIELTGTPAPNGLHDLWSQVYLLDQGQALGHNITAFRKCWFTAKTYNGVPTKWLPVPGAEAEIHQAIAHLVMSVQNTDLNLPDLLVDDVFVSLTPDLLKAYKEFKAELVLDIVVGGLDDDQRRKGLADPDVQVAVKQIVAANQAVLTNKLLQFANGALYTGDADDPATKGDYTVIHDRKLEMAAYLIRNNNNSPVLVAYTFQSDKELLLRRLHDAGIGAVAFDGSRAMVHRWNAGSIPVMLIHPASAGHGLNLQDGGHTLLWYGLTYDLEHYIQTNGRLHRKGQSRPVTIYRLMTRGTQDERLPVVLASKQATQDRLLDSVDGETATLAALEAELFDDLNDMWTTTRL
jgi:SNF2 family DNA or RNA helicase